MLKIYSTLACAVMSLSAFAAVDLNDYTASPAEGNVESLETVAVTFPNVYELDINTKDDIQMLLDGNAITGTNVSCDGNILTVKFNEPQTAKGEYTLSILPYALSGLNESYSDYTDNEEAIELKWNIAAPEGELDFKWTANPDPKGVYLKISTVTLTFPELDSVSFEDPLKVSAYYDDTLLTGYGISASGNKLTVDFTQLFLVDFKDPGKINIKFDADALSGVKGDVKGSNKEEISLYYTVVYPVVYDLTLALSSPTEPNENGEISANKQLDAFYFYADVPGLLPAEGDENNVVIRAYDGSYEVVGHLKKANGLNASRSYFRINTTEEPAYNGRYEIVIDKGAFGDNYWMLNHEAGRSNDKIILRFTLVDGVSAEIYTIKATSVNPAAGTYKTGDDIAEITVEFNSDIQAVAGASAMLGGVDVSDYVETAEFVSTGAGKFTVRFPAPTSKGTYRFTAQSGLFGDAKYIAGEAGGKASKAITIEYTVSETSGVSAILSGDSEPVIHNIHGVKIDKSFDYLPAGIYVIDGKKTIKK